MKFNVLLTVFNAKTRFRKCKNIQVHFDAESGIQVSQKTVIEQSLNLSPHELENRFLEDMADAMYSLPMTKTINLRVSVSHVQVGSLYRKIHISDRLEFDLSTLSTGTTACTSTPSGLTETTLVRVPSRNPNSSIPPKYDAGQPTLASSRVLCVDDFIPIKFLGAGGFGRVYLVLDKITRKYFALKVVEKKRMHVSFFTKIFEEQRIGRALVDSKWYAGVVGSFDDSDNFYILMNYSAGGDLLYRIRTHSALDHNVVRHVFADLIIALEDLHNRCIMHRDIKPANILIDDDGHLLFADFGFSRSFDVAAHERPWEHTPEWSAHPTNKEVDAVLDGDGRDLAVDQAGTPGYTAPEILAGMPYSYECDVFSLGVVIYVLLFDASPFGVDYTVPNAGVAERVASAPVEFPAHAGPRTRDILARMLEKDPRRRITIPEMKAHTFFRSFNWEIVAQRGPNPDLKQELFRGIVPHLVHKQQTVCIPAGTPFEVGHNPFPWFEYVSPTLTEPTTSAKIPIAHMGLSKDAYADHEVSRSKLVRVNHTRKSQKSDSFRAVVLKKMKILRGNLIEVKPHSGERMIIE